MSSHLFTEGRFKTTLKNFSKTSSKAASVMAGLASTTVLAPLDACTPGSFAASSPFVATLCFFRKAAEKPEAQT